MLHPGCKIKLFFPLICSGLIAFGCSGNNVSENRKTSRLEKITGENYVMPQVPARLTYSQNEAVSFSDIPKLIIYFNGYGCTPCSLKELRHWRPLFNEIDSMKKSGFNLDVVLILKTSEDDANVRQVLTEHEFRYPVIFDEDGQFERFNLLPENDLMHTFLLDKDNKVALAGNPLLRNWELFKATIIRLNKERDRHIR